MFQKIKTKKNIHNYQKQKKQSVWNALFLTELPN